MFLRLIKIISIIFLSLMAWAVRFVGESRDTKKSRNNGISNPAENRNELDLAA